MHYNEALLKPGSRIQSSAAPVYFALLADVVLFFHRPLFSSQYIFPWDFRGVQLPMLSYLADELHSGRFALWSPFTYCGYPVFANIEGCFFHPMILLGTFLSSRTSLDSLPRILEWIVVFQVWFAGIICYHLFREFGAGRPAAFAGAVIFQTGGYMASRAEHIGAMMAVAWMPLAWLAVLRLRQPPRLRWLAVLGAALGMSILGGFPQPTLAVFVSTVAFSLMLPACRISRFSTIPYVAAGCLLGIALASVQFVPTAQLTGHSVAKYRAEWLGAGGGLYWESLVSLVAPNYYSIFDMSRFHGPGDATFLYLYCGIGGLLLALYALLAIRNRNVAVLACITLFGMIWMLGDKTPVWRAVYPMLPRNVRIGIHPEYTYGIFTLGIAGLAAMGLEAVRAPTILRWAAGLVIAADLFFVGSGRPMNCTNLKEDPGVTRYAFDGDRAVLDSIRRAVEKDFPPSRIDTADASMQWVVNAPLTRIPTASGVSPLAPDGVIRLRLFLHQGYRWGWYYPVEKFDSPVLDLMNVRYVIASGRAVERLGTLPRFRHIASLRGNEVFENSTVMPRFFLVHRVRPAASVEEAARMIERGEIDFRDAAITDRRIELSADPSAPGVSTPAPGAEGARGSAEGARDSAESVRVVDYHPASLDLAVQSRGTSFLVMSETAYPGWKAWLDGKPAPIYPADLAFRGVVVPDGSHSVRMEFRPVILPISIGISLATAILLIVLARLDRTSKNRTA